MAVTIQQVNEALQQLGLKFKQLDERGIILGLRSGPVMLKLLVFLDEGGKYLDICAFEMLKCGRDHPALEKLLEILAKANYTYKLVRFSWDRDSGSVNLRGSVLIEDSSRFTKDHVGLILAALQKVTMDVWPDVQKVMGDGAGGETDPTDRKGEGKARVRPAPAAPPTSAAPVAPKPARGNPALWVLGAGVLLIGLAALIAALSFFFGRH
ncbi:MAG: YbjN domain-containing protein [Planctomycetes bacterium]|nr:YbjN domain-containing protein [Planctomycetota bacterium]